MDAWGPVCTAAGAIRAPLRSRVPFHSRLGNWPSDSTTAAIADPQELGPPNAYVPFSILSFSFIILLIGINGTLSQG